MYICIGWRCYTENELLETLCTLEMLYIEYVLLETLCILEMLYYVLSMCILERLSWTYASGDGVYTRDATLNMHYWGGVTPSSNLVIGRCYMYICIGWRCYTENELLETLCTLEMLYIEYVLLETLCILEMLYYVLSMCILERLSWTCASGDGVYTRDAILNMHYWR